MNFMNDIEEHQQNVKKEIQQLQENTDFLDHSPLEDVKLFFLYVNNKKLENYEVVELDINDNMLTKNNLMVQIIKHKKYDNKKYVITNLYQYHFKDDLGDFIESNILSNSMTSYDKVENISFEPNIDFFQDYSCLFVILENNKGTQTRKNGSILKNKTARKLTH
jgi:hypothetical protein